MKIADIGESRFTHDMAILAYARVIRKAQPQFLKGREGSQEGILQRRRGLTSWRAAAWAIMAPSAARRAREGRRRGHEVMTAECDQLRGDAQHSRATLLDKYGAQDEAEFFAVATECFFDCQVELRERHARLYEQLCQYYRQDPAARVAQHATTPRQTPN